MIKLINTKACIISKAFEDFLSLEAFVGAQKIRSSLSEVY